MRFGNFPERHEKGQSLCKWCGAPVPKGRRYFCCKEHAYEVQIRRDSSFLRARTKERDHGICARCGIDTEELKRVLRFTRESLADLLLGKNKQWGNLYWFSKIMRERWGYNVWTNVEEMCHWQADHIIEVTDGGSPYMDNIATLCVPCHKSKTKASHSKRTERRKSQLSLI